MVERGSLDRTHGVAVQLGGSDRQACTGVESQSPQVGTLPLPPFMKTANIRTLAPETHELTLSLLTCVETDRHLTSTSQPRRRS